MGNSWKWFVGLIILLSLIGSGIIYIRYTKDRETAMSAKLPGTVRIASAGSPTVTSEVTSADGSVKVVIDKITQSTGNTIYTFTTAKGDGSNTVQIYKTALPSGSILSAPLNSWSPNNRYLFLKEKSNNGSSYFVFNGNGEKFGEQQFINVGEVFASKDTGYNLKEVTGWDSDTLLHVDAEKDGGESAHFWFEIPSTAVIRLAR